MKYNLDIPARSFMSQKMLSYSCTFFSNLQFLQVNENEFILS